MKRPLLLLMFLVCVVDALPCQTDDTTKVYSFKEIVVTATRSEIRVEDSPSGVDVITRDEIVSSGGSTIADLLKQETTLFVKDQGSNGALKTLSIRGTAAEHVLVLVNGNRQNSFQNGLVDLSLLPLNDIERIEVVHGGSSALYGADALGGVVNVITRSASVPLQVRTEAGAGSFGYERFLLEGEARAGIVGLLAGYSSERGRDDFSFHSPSTNPEAVFNRAGNDFHRRQSYLHGDIAFDNRSGLRLSGQLVRSNIGVPGPFVDPTTPPLARQQDDNANFSLGYVNQHFDRIIFNIQSNFRYSLQTYVDPNPIFPMNSFYKNTFVSVNPQVQYRLSDVHKLSVGGEFGQGMLESNDFDSQIARVQKAAYASSETQFAFDRPTFDRLTLYATLRYDDISDVGASLTPKVGFNIRLARSGDLRFRASVGRNFRSPSFNDLYYRGFSNPGLKPERSTSIDAGFTASTNAFGTHFISTTYFHLNTVDRILLDQNYVPQNIGRVITNGVEFEYEGRFIGDILKFGISYTYTDARKRNRDSPDDPTYDRRIPNTPADVLGISFKVNSSPATLYLTTQSVGQRYTRADNTEVLPAYSIVDVGAIVQQSVGLLRVFVKAEVRNLLDTDYEVLKFYPMPKRNFRFTLGVQY